MMRKKLSRSIVAAAVLTTWLSTPVLAATIPQEPATPNGAGAYIYVNGNSTQTNFDIGTVSGWEGTNQGAVVNFYSNKSIVLNSIDGGVQNYVNNIAGSDTAGAIYNGVNNQTDSITINGSAKFQENQAYRGGAIYNEGTMNFQDGEVTFTGNKGTQDGLENWSGGGAIVNIDGNLNFNGGKVTFTNNSSVGNGGAILFGNTGINTSANINVNTIAEFTGNTSTKTGGALSNFGGTLTVDSAGGKVIVSGNSTTGNGGAFYNDANSTMNLGNYASLTDNHANGFGGAIYNNTGDVTLGDRATFEKNYISSTTLTNSGGAIYNTAGDITIGKNATFKENNVIGALDPTGDGTQGAAGGAIASWNAGNVTIGEKATFTNNGSLTTMTDGGAIYFSGDASTSANKGVLTIGANSVFDGNKSMSRGGAIYNGDAIVKTGDNVTFQNNKSSSGGAIYSLDSFGNTKNEIGTNNKFYYNTATDNSGGAIMAISDMSIGAGADFKNNTAGYAGGAIKNYGTTTIGINANFESNKAKADDMGGGAISNSASLTIDTNATFKSNNATNAGGAIHNNGTALIVKGGATFTGNTAGTNGGAIYNAANMELNTTGGNITFTGNTATGQGGAIYNAANMELNTTAGNITFAGNTANGVANDILAAASSVTNITGTKNVSIGSGLTTLADSSLNIKDTSALVIESTAKADIAGSIDSDTGAYLVNNGETTISGTNNVNITNNADLTVSGDGASNITNNSDLTVKGNAASIIKNNATTVLGGNYTGTLSQKDKNASVTISNGATFNSATSVIEGGTLKIASGGILQGNLSVTDAVRINIVGGDSVIDSTGLVVGNSGHIVMSGTSSLNLSGDYTVFGGVLGTSVIISNGAINAQSAGPLTIISNRAINAQTAVPLTIDNSKVLTLSDNATSDGAFVVGDTGVLKLAPKTGGSLTLSANNSVSSVSDLGQVLVDEIVVTEQTYDPSTGGYTPTTLHYGVGTVNLANDNSGFSGTYLQKMGNVIAQAGSKFFGGTNTVEGGSLTLQKGAVLTANVSATDNGNGGYGTINIYNDIEGTVGSNGINRIADTDITNGVIRYVNSGGTIKNVNITKAGLGLFNGTRVEGDSSGTLSLVSTAGVRDLTFGNGSGSEADVISLGNGTKLTYKDNAYIKDDSKVELGANATLNFDNDTTNIEYRPVITSTDTTALISQTGEGETVISSSLRDFNGSVNVNYGSLELANEDAISLNNITADNGDLSIAADTTANKVTVGNDSEFVAKKSLTVYDTLTVNNSQATVNGETRAATATADFKGSDSVVNLKGASFFGNMNLNGATMNAYNNVNVTGTMTLSNNPTIGLVNGGINTINANTLDMTSSGAKIAFDVNPRSLATDSIVVNNILGNSTSPYKLLITGINLTTSPIDRNVNIDISNLLRDSSGSRSDAVALRDGGIIARTAMGDYAITASSSNMLNASLLAMNSQMYRGQVATLASWQNQLVVNNMMFDHMQVVTRQLMDDAKTANKYSAILPQFAPYQYSAKDGSLWYKAYGNFERVSMTRGLSVGNNAYGSLIGADFPLVELKNGWKIVPTAFIGYNGGHQTYDGVSMYQNGAQLGLMGTAYKGNFLTSLLAYGGGYGNDMSVKGQYGGGSDTTGNWFAGVASKSAYNIHLPHDFIFQPTAMVTYNAFGNQNWGSSFGAMSMSTGMLNGINAAPGFNLIWNKKTFSIYATAQMVYNIMGGVDAKAGNIDLGYVRMRHSYFEYGLGVTKRFKDTFNGYLQLTFRNGGRTGVGFQGGIQWKPGKDKK